MATKAEILADPNSAFNRAGDDEPLFVLRGHDFAAGATIMDWCDYRRRAIRQQRRPKADAADIQTAAEIADEMERYYDEEPRK